MPKTIGTYDSPLKVVTPMLLAKAFVDDQFVTGRGLPSLYEYRGDFWNWQNDVWRIHEFKLIEDELWKWIDGAFALKLNKEGEWKPARIPYGNALVKDTMRCLEATRRLEIGPVPRWLRSAEDLPDPEFCVGFQDLLIDLKASAKEGQWVSAPRSEIWFDCVTVPVKFDPKATCPTWLKCCEQWGGGDPLWTKVLQREMGYSLMAFRGYAKWFMHYGRSRAGKGTIEKIRRALIGEYGYTGLKMSSLGKQFGLHSLIRSRVVTVAEVTELEKQVGEEASGNLKSILGQDPIPLDRKHRDQQENVVSPAMVVIMGNELPRLPNKGNGLASKMVPLNFDQSFVGKENVHLDKELLAELPGIAAWAMQGALELVKEQDSASRFPLTEGAKEAMHKYTMLNNEADSFLGWGFVPRKGGWVASELVWARYEEFSVFMKSKPVARNMFNNWLEAQNSWNVVKGKEPQGTRNGFRGIGLKAEPSYEE